MITVMLLTGAALVIDEGARKLAATARQAMKDADLTIDWVARTINVPPQKLSDQLLGKTPFTAFWRFGIRELREETAFWVCFATLLDKEFDRITVPKEIGVLVARVDVLTGAFEQLAGYRMAKASLPEPRMVQLPLKGADNDTTVEDGGVPGDVHRERRDHAHAGGGHPRRVQLA